MLLGFGILLLALGWLLLYAGYAGVGVGAMVAHVFNPTNNPAPHPTNPRVGGSGS